MEKPTFYQLNMRDIGITDKSIIFNHKELTQYMPGEVLNRGDIIQIIYNNNRIPDNTIYVWNGTELDSIYNRWDVCDVNEVGPDYFAESQLYDLPRLKINQFIDTKDGFYRSSVSLAGKDYQIKYATRDTPLWVINEGYIKLIYKYDPENDIIIADSYGRNSTPWADYYIT
jgi:hypothetical protein